MLNPVANEGMFLYNEKNERRILMQSPFRSSDILLPFIEDLAGLF